MVNSSWFIVDGPWLLVIGCSLINIVVNLFCRNILFSKKNILISLVLLNGESAIVNLCIAYELSTMNHEPNAQECDATEAESLLKLVTKKLNGIN